MNNLAPASGLSAQVCGQVGGFRLDAVLDLPARGVTALVGPSGAGKTTLLRWIAGLERLEGRLSVAGEVWQGQGLFLPPHRRAVGYVFQEASLLPHLSVRANLEYGFRRVGGGDRRASFAEVVERLALAPLLDRSPARLSGGERQRVALGRALLTRPRLLLMDEPLAGLDQDSKAEILPFIEGLHGSLAIPVLYVSHDLGEVARLADRVLVMRGGRISIAAAEDDPLQRVRRLDRAALERLALAALAAGLEAASSPPG